MFNSFFTELLIILLVGSISTVCCYETSFNSDDVYKILKKGRLKRNLPFLRIYQKTYNDQSIKTTLKLQTVDDIDNKKASEESLKLRKVWSRWGKWSECSVTCGEGTISRKRVCVLGRCAPGEMEEQRHPCNRAPCLHIDDQQDMT